MKCWICGKENAEASRNLSKLDKHGINIFIDNEAQRMYCQECLEKKYEQRSEDIKEYVRLKKKLMFEKAVNKLEHQDMYFEELREAIEVVREALENDNDKFDSSEEVMSAIILIDNEIHIKPQYKIGKYQVDFLIPDWNVVLEIDGERHSHRKQYDRDRDKKILEILGKEWEIIRIPTTFINKHARELPKAICSVRYMRRNNISENDMYKKLGIKTFTTDDFLL